MASSEHFWKLSSTKFAPRLRARAIWKSKPLKHQVLGTFLEVESPFCVAGAGISTGCKIRGRRRSSWRLQKRWQAWWIWRGSETMRFASQAQGFRALWCPCLKAPTQNPWKGCKFAVTEVLLRSDHFAWQLQEFVCLGSTFSWQAQYFWSIQLKIAKTYCNSEVKCLVDMPFLKEVSQKWASKLHFWRKSRRNASFLSFKASFLKEVSQKCFVFELQSFNFERSLAQKKEVSQKSFVFERQSFIFEGSLAEKLRFWSSKLDFWRKSRRNASFLIFKASFLKEVSHKSFVFELPSFIFEGSLAETLCFWSSKLHFWRKSRRKASFDKIFWITHRLTTKSLEPQIIWHPNHLNLKSIDNQLIWISNRLTTKSLESQINWQPNHLNLKSIDKQNQSIDNQTTWISNPLTTNSLESQIGWPPNHLNLKLIDNQIAWISNQLTTTSLEVQINRQPKPFEAHIDSQPNQVNLKSIDNQINWISNQLTTKTICISNQMATKSFDSQLVWIWHQLTFEPIELRTLPSYRFLIFGNFRRRLVR